MRLLGTKDCVPTRLVIFPDENHWVLNGSKQVTLILSLRGSRVGDRGVPFQPEVDYGVFRWFDSYVGKGRCRGTTKEQRTRGCNDMGCEICRNIWYSMRRDPRIIFAALRAPHL